MSAAKLLLDRDAIASRVARLGAEIAADHPGGVVLVGVLKGSLLFLADLVRAVPEVPVAVDFIAISRYAPDSGRVRILKDVDLDLTGRGVVVVEDLVDTGLTLAYLLGHLEARGPASLSVCALLDRTPRRIVPLEVRYRGEEIGEQFVLGYGLHLADRFRNLREVYEADRTAVEADPDALVAALYRRTPPGGEG